MWVAPAGATVMTERELNEKLKAEHLFGDHAIRRRELVERGLLRRPLDCMRYEAHRKKPQPRRGADPPPGSTPPARGSVSGRAAGT
jgi:hypothetical protein